MDTLNTENRGVQHEFYGKSFFSYIAEAGGGCRRADVFETLHFTQKLQQRRCVTRLARKNKFVPLKFYAL